MNKVEMSKSDKNKINKSDRNNFINDNNKNE